MSVVDRSDHVRRRPRPSACYLPVEDVTGGSSKVCVELGRHILLRTGRGDVRINTHEAIELIRELEAAIKTHDARRR